MANGWEVVVERYNAVVTKNGGAMDPFKELVKRDGASSVTISVSRALPYGELKVSASVSVSCDQDQPTIEQAGEVAFLQAVKLVQAHFTELTEG